MSFKRLGLSELIGVLGAVLLVVSLFVPWFETDPSNPFSQIDTFRGKVTPWQAFQSLPIFLILAAIAPIWLAWIVLRGHELGWNRGEITTIVGVISFILVFGNGIVFGRPGANPVDVQLWWGYLLALVACLMICIGGVLRQAESPPPPEPPGV
jgi:hypothetical protein